MASTQKDGTFLPTNEEDHRFALIHAWKHVDYTQDPQVVDQRPRLSKIYLDKLVEGPIFRELESGYGITVKYDSLISIKGLRVRRKIVDPELAAAYAMATNLVARVYALVPVEELNALKNICIFTNALLVAGQDPETGMEITTEPALLTYPRWATKEEVQGWSEYTASRRATYTSLHPLSELSAHLHQWPPS